MESGCEYCNGTSHLQCKYHHLRPDADGSDGGDRKVRNRDKKNYSLSWPVVMNDGALDNRFVHLFRVRAFPGPTPVDTAHWNHELFDGHVQCHDVGGPFV